MATPNSDDAARTYPDRIESKRSTGRARTVGIVASIGLAAATVFAVLFFAADNEEPASAATNTASLAPETPRRDLPRALDGQVRDAARVGDFIVVGGDFTEVRRPNGTIKSVTGAYAFHIDSGALVEAFDPVIRRNNDMPEVLAVEPAGPNSVFLGGKFNSVDGRNHHGVTKITLSNGATDPSFSSDVNGGWVTDIVVRNGRMFVGGEFTRINGVNRSRLAEIRPSSGSVVTGFSANITGSTREDGIPFGPRQLAITPNNVLVVAHRGTTVGGQERPGVALINLGNNRVLPWQTDFYESLDIHTVDAEVSPDGTYIVLAGDGGDFPFLGRDSAVAFDIDNVNATNVEPRWIARNFDSTFAVGISEDAVYLGGHFCWVEAPGSPEPWPGDGEFSNNNSCFGSDPAGRFAPEVLNRDQIAAFDPETGKALEWDPGSDGFIGIVSIEVIDRGVLVGHDGTLMGRDGDLRRAWNVGRFGFFDRTRNDGLTVNGSIDQTVTGTCDGHTPTMRGTNGNDVLIGTDGPDVIMSGTGRDRIEGLGGNDLVCAGRDNDIVNGGPGNDILHGNEAADVLNGGFGDDELWGGLWRDTLNGGPGNDLLRGGSGADILRGGLGNDTAFGWQGQDVIEGGAGNDTVNGQAGRDTVIGGPGADTVIGGVGRDLCAGSTVGNPNNPGDTRRGCER